MFRLLTMLLQPASLMALGYVALSLLLAALGDTVWGGLRGYPLIAQLSLLLYVGIIVTRAYGWERTFWQFPWPPQRVQADWLRWALTLPIAALYLVVPLLLQSQIIGLPSLPEASVLLGIALLSASWAVQAELIWRGILAGSLLGHLHPLAAVILAGICAGLGQGAVQYVMSDNMLLAWDTGLTFGLLGVLFAALYAISRSLWLTLLLHFATLLFVQITRPVAVAFESMDQVVAAFQQTLIVLLPVLVFLAVVLYRYKGVTDDFKRKAD